MNILEAAQIRQRGSYHSKRDPSRFHTVSFCTEGNNIETHYLAPGAPYGAGKCAHCKQIESRPTTTFAQLLGLKPST